MEKNMWSDIPSIGNLAVDWDYEPENPLGKRAAARMRDLELSSLLNVDTIRVQVATNKFTTQGTLADLSSNGIAVHLQRKVDSGTMIKLGMYLGRRKFISKGIVRNVSDSEGQCRAGIEFLGTDEEDKKFIEGLHSSISYKP